MDSLLCYHVLLIITASVALSLLWVGFATPGWFVVTFQERLAQNEYTVSSLNMSLYYDVHCPQEYQTCKTCMAGDEPDCSTKLFADTKMTRAFTDDIGTLEVSSYINHYSWTRLLISQKEEWKAWRALMTIVVVSSFIGFILVIVLVCCLLKPFTYRVVAICGFIFWLIAGLLVWVPVGMVADMHLEVDDAINDNIEHDATLHVPYSLVIAALGGFIALIVALMLLWLTGICGNTQRDSDSSSRSSIEIYSDRPKSHVYVREEPYYGPHPYYAPEVPHYQTEYVPSYIQRPPSNDMVTVVDDYPRYAYNGPAAKWYDNRY